MPHVHPVGLVCQFEAHRRLGEASGLVSVGFPVVISEGHYKSIEKYGRPLLEDPVRAELVDFHVNEESNN